MNEKFEEGFCQLKQDKADLEKQIAELINEFEKRYSGVIVKKLKIEVDYEGNNEVSAKIEFHI